MKVQWQVTRRAMAHATGTGWSLRRLRERVLRAGARLIIPHGA